MVRPSVERIKTWSTRTRISTRFTMPSLRESGLSEPGSSIEGQVYVDSRSREFDVNDLGFMNQNDRIQLDGCGLIRNPYKRARRSLANINVWRHGNLDKVLLREVWNFNTWHNLHSYWIRFGAERNSEAFDDLVTRGGPTILTPPSWEVFSISIQTTKKRSRSFCIRTGPSATKVNRSGRAMRRRSGISPFPISRSSCVLDTDVTSGTRSGSRMSLTMTTERMTTSCLAN